MTEQEVLTRIEVNCETGVATEVPLTAEEILQSRIDAVQADLARIEAEDEDRARATARMDVLEKLGITEDEAKLLIA